MSKIKFDFSDFIKFSKKNPGFNPTEVLRRGFLRAMIVAQSHTAKEHLSAPGRGRVGNKGPWIENPYKDKLRTLTGRLRADWMSNFPRVTMSGRKMVGELGSNLIYARHHEETVVEKFGQPRAPFSKGVKGAEKQMQTEIFQAIVKKMKEFGYK
jgi:hypothetical protein